MKRRRLDGKRQRVPQVDQEKSNIDILEHVIRGVRLDRLRELLRERERQRKHGHHAVWVAHPTTA